MDARVYKLQHFGFDKDEAAELVAAGFDTPRKLKAAKDEDLEKVKGIKAKKVRDAMSKKLKKSK